MSDADQRLRRILLIKIALAYFGVGAISALLGWVTSSILALALAFGFVIAIPLFVVLLAIAHARYEAIARRPVRWSLAAAGVATTVFGALVWPFGLVAAPGGLLCVAAFGLLNTIWWNPPPSAD